jgi:S-adenosylmethionine decarboxylase
MKTKTKRSIHWVKEDQKRQYAGIHLLAEFWNGKVVEDKKKMEKILNTAVKKANNTPLKLTIYKFKPQGMTGIVLLAESHISIHTWPEYNYAALDFYTCGKKSNPFKALEYLKKELKPKKCEVKIIKRGFTRNP